MTNPRLLSKLIRNYRDYTICSTTNTDHNCVIEKSVYVLRSKYPNSIPDTTPGTIGITIWCRRIVALRIVVRQEREKSEEMIEEPIKLEWNECPKTYEHLITPMKPVIITKSTMFQHAMVDIANWYPLLRDYPSWKMFMDDSRRCSICYDPISERNVAILCACPHIFCLDCLRESFRKFG